MKIQVSKKKLLLIGMLLCLYIGYILFMYILLKDYKHIMKIDLFIRFSIATLLLIISHIFVSEIFKDYKCVENIDLYNQYYNTIVNTYNNVFKISGEIIHNKLTKYELECNVAMLKKQKDFLKKTNIPKEFKENHLEIIKYIDEILDTLN